MNPQKLLYSGGAIGTIILPQLLARQSFSFLPALSDKVSLTGCTGSCGNCSGSCIGVIAPLLFLSYCACRGKKH